MAKYNTLTALFTAIANSLRGKTGGTGKIVADDFPSVIDGLSTGGITPSGTKNITTNGSHDVSTFATAQVNVPVPSGYIKPNGTKSITTNGTHDVTSYASASVNVPVPSGYIKPSGTKEIVENGTHDVTNYASAVVNVPTGGGSDNYHVVNLSFASDLGVDTTVIQTLVTNDSFVKANYAKDGFFAMLIPVNAGAITHNTNVVPFVYSGNRVIINCKNTGYALLMKGVGASSYAAGQVNTTKLSGNGYLVSLRATSAGNINLYIASGYTVPAGDYRLVYALAE